MDDPGAAAGFRHPFDPSVWAAPYGAYRWLAEHDPLYADQYSGMVFTTRYADCDALLRARSVSAALAQQQRLRGDALPTSMLNTDPPEHDRLRAPAMRLLGPAVIDSLAAAFRAEVDRVLDGLDGRDTIDGLADVGWPFATGVLAVLLGLPDDDRPTFTGLARAASVHLNPLAGPAETAMGGRASGLLVEMLRACAAAAESGPLADYWAGTELDEGERMATLMLVVIGGWEPLANVAATGLHYLARQPELLGQLVDEAAALAFADEVLRLESPIPFIARQITEPTTVPSGELEPGVRTLVLLGAGNRDPEVFEAPDEIRLDRAPNPHLAFGAGVHFCPAAPLVRLVGGQLFADIARRFPQLRPEDPEAKPRWRASIVPRGLAGVAIRL
jgi:cytochrome P450